MYIYSSLDVGARISGAHSTVKEKKLSRMSRSRQVVQDYEGLLDRNRKARAMQTEQIQLSME